MKQWPDKIQSYIGLLKDYNQRVNIYSESAYDKLDFHVQDSINMAALIGNKKQLVVDLGSGGGLPSVIVAIQNPLCQVLAIESKGRKAAFLTLVGQELSLDNFDVLAQNVYEVSPFPKSDIITAKAFKPLEDLMKLRQKCKLKKPRWIVPVSSTQVHMMPTQFRRDVIEREVCGVVFFYFLY